MVTRAEDNLVKKMWIEGHSFSCMAEKLKWSHNRAYQRATVFLRLHKSHARAQGARSPRSEQYKSGCEICKNTTPTHDSEKV